MNQWIKDPDATLDYTVDWSDWLEEDDTISDLEVVADAGVTVEASSNSATTATAWVSGGTVGARYAVRFRVTTVGGRTDDRTVYLTIKQR